MSAAILVVELLTEELPPKALKALGESLAQGVAKGLAERGFLAPASGTASYATPRRLAVKITQVLAVSPDKPVRQKLMPASVALDAAGRPAMALRKRLEALGHGVLAERWPDHGATDERLARESDGKADAIFLYSVARGVPLRDGLQAALDAAIAALPIPKVMTYQREDGSDLKFVRPVHRLLALHGAGVVPITAFGLAAGRSTDGHRFLGRRDLDIATAAAYEETLAAEGKVVASYADRRAQIAAALAKAANGAMVIMPDALLDEVTALVEWPAVYAGSFDPAFLEVPQECLILTMQQNQKYFALADAAGGLQNRFLLVSNIASADPSAIVEGNERVLRARLADARFFYDQDRKQPLAARLPKLAAVVFHNQLGSQLERVERLERLAGDIADLIGADGAAARRAARLAKADLVTDMVGEFPELQGLMGRYYADHDGEAPAVASAIEQHYWPRFAGDALPESGIAQAVALADKLDSITGMFAIGEVPTGDRDPFGLRRAALGILRILIERKLQLNLVDCVTLAIKWHESEEPQKAWATEIAQQRPAARGGEMSTFGASYQTRRIPEPVKYSIMEFLYERLRGTLRELGNSANQVEAVLCLRPARLDVVPALLDAVRAFSALPEAQSLAAANKRIVNILRKAEDRLPLAVDRALLTDGAEYDLYTMFQTLAPAVEKHEANGDYKAMLLALAAAKPVVDRFFDDVLVMTGDPALRANRLALLSDVAKTMNRVADISKLAA